LELALVKDISVKVGSPAPDFALQDQNGKTAKLRDFRGQRVILFFYVRDNTPGCIKEACNFRDGLDKLKAEGVVVLGISADSAESHVRFAQKYQLPFPLLADQNAEVAKKYRVWGKKNMYGRTFYGIIRSTFIIDGKGNVSREYRRVKVDGHFDEILEDLK
jgi:peroxiredoxin Q/BCP